MELGNGLCFERNPLVTADGWKFSVGRTRGLTGRIPRSIILQALYDGRVRRSQDVTRER